MEKLEVTKKRVRVEMALGECIEDIQLEYEVKFPVEVRKIKDVCAEVGNIIAKPDEDKILIEGKIFKKVIWVAGCDGVYQGVAYEAGGIYDLPVEENFSHYIPLPGAIPSAQVVADVRIKDLDLAEKSKGTSDSPDVWIQCIVLEVYAKAGVMLDADIATDVVCPDANLNVIKDTCGIENIVGEWEREVHLVADIEFPRHVAHIVSVQTRLTDLESVAMAGRVHVSGVLHKRIYYAEQHTNRLYETSMEEPWNETLDLPQVHSGSEVYLEAMVVYSEIAVNPENNQKARQRVIIKVKCRIVEDLVLSYVKDVKGTGCHILKGSLDCNDLIGYGCAEVVINKDICFDQPVRKIVSKDAIVKFKHQKTEVAYGEVWVAGELYKNICYLDMCHGAIWEKCIMEPFETKIQVIGAEPGMKVRLTSKVKKIDLVEPIYPRDCCEDTNFLPVNYPWRQTAEVEVRAKVFASRQLEVVTEVVCEPVPSPSPTPCPTSPPCPPSLPPTKGPGECLPGSPGQPSMRFYIIQQGDTIYKLAGKYGTTVEAIMAANPGIDPYNLQIGQVIKIPCGVPGAKG